MKLRRKVEEANGEWVLIQPRGKVWTATRLRRGSVAAFRPPSRFQVATRAAEGRLDRTTVDLWVRLVDNP
jgi:hypothetical protein